MTTTRISDPLSLCLTPELARLREVTLAEQHAGLHGLPLFPLVDADTWAHRPEGQDWLEWRGRRVAARLRAMPVALTPGEDLVGRPDLRPTTQAEADRLEAVRPVLDSIPPFPGGDAGHLHPDYRTLFQLGLGGLRRQVAAYHERADADRQAFYRACEDALEGLAAWVVHVADTCDAAADGANGDTAAWRRHADRCRHLVLEPPGDFHEALQLLFLTLVALWFAEDHTLTSPGRLDRTLAPFYDADVTAGRLTPQRAFELICTLFIQLNRICPAGLAVSVLVGGRHPDGTDATHPLTWLTLAARHATRLVYPTVGLCWHEGTPAALTDLACRMLGDGGGDPAFFNDTLIAASLRDHGVSREDAVDYMNSTCVEIKVVGASNIWVTAPYFNCAGELLASLDAAVESEAKVGPDGPAAHAHAGAHAATGGEPVSAPATYGAFEALLRRRFETTVSAAAADLDRIWRQRAETGGFPLASCLTRDCLECGLDLDRGGARYHWVENSFVGLANLADSLVTIRHLVYDTGQLSLAQLRDLLRTDFAGAEPLRQRILERLPHYGNDDDEADAVARRWAHTLQDLTAACTVGGHRYVPGFFCWVMHGRLGAQTGATPDGRRAGTALADGAGAAQGRERQGPTASILSTTSWDHRRALGGLVHNLKLTAATLAGDAGLACLRTLVETYLGRGGFEIQVNVISPETLRAAQARPEEHADLLVRVAGYSDYFVHLDATLQAEVIERTEHEL